MKPNLFIVGAPKCGTSAWVEYLGSHPDIGFARAKEPHFFCYDFPDWRATRSVGEYLELFSDCAGRKVIGEASVQYLYSELAAEEIRRFNPDAKILIFLRKQEDQLPSVHNQLLYNRDESIEDFELAWRLSGRRDATNIPSTCREPKLLDYAAMGRFHEQVERYVEHFPPDQIQVLRFEEWQADPRNTYVRILAFLGVPDDGRTDFQPVHEAKHYRSDFIASLSQSPPEWVLKGSSALKRLIGRKQLGLARHIRTWNSKRGYRSTASEAVKEAIRTHFFDDNARLDRLLKRLASDRSNG